MPPAAAMEIAGSSRRGLERHQTAGRLEQLEWVQIAGVHLAREGVRALASVAPSAEAEAGFQRCPLAWELRAAGRWPRTGPRVAAASALWSAIRQSRQGRPTQLRQWAPTLV